MYGYLDNPSYGVVRRVNRSSTYGAYGSYAAPGSYGEIWWAKDDRLAQCPDMLKWYKKYLDALEKQKALKPKRSWRWLGIVPTRSANSQYKRLEDLQEEYERRGWGAWKKCKGMVKVDAAEQAALEMDDLLSDTQVYTPGSDPFSSQMIPLSTTTSGMTSVTSAEPGKSPNYLLWTAVGGAGLLGLIYFLRKD
jgi:hypothetical protein